MGCIPLFIPVLFHRISIEVIISTRAYEQHDAVINWAKNIFSKLVPIVANDTVDYWDRRITEKHTKPPQTSS